MDLNVCSRRVHDGYATIRSRGRSRPRAVYRSDSEEFLKEAGGPYALPQLSNFPVVIARDNNNDLQQVPRWSDLGKDCLLIENYGTLRGSKKGNPSPERRRLVTLNTFSKVEQGHGQGQPSDDAFSSRSESRKQDFSIDRVYDDVCAEERLRNGTLPSFRSKSDAFKDRGDPPRLAEDRFRPTATLDSDLKRLKEIESYADCSARRGGRRSVVDVRRDDARLRRIGDTKGRQPIYAVPNILSRSRRDRRVAIVDGNYVPSGDLYRTTAKYIEDINKNIAEIDKSYEELKSSSNSRNNSSTYGVINRIAKGELIDQPGNLCGYARKRDMAPMPPISSDFGESLLEEKIAERQSDSDAKTESLDNSSSVLILKSGRPNSFGKLPPKLLPRSSSIENTSRHSTGSTTTSSTKSTESLYAISEVGHEVKSGGIFQNGGGGFGNNQVGFKQDPASTEGSDELESKDEMSSTDDDRPTIVRSVERLPVTSSIRKNRSRVDSVDRSYLKRDRVSTCQMSRCDSVRRSNDLAAASEKNFYKSVAKPVLSESSYSERRYDTLPTRRSRTTSRPLHKSSEDVLDGERLVRARSSSLHRPCTSDLDVSERNDERPDNRKNNLDNLFSGGRPPPLYLMDATDVIMRGQLDRRTSRGLQWQDHLSTARSSCRRTRHNSLESEEPENKDNDDNRRHGGFATLPRRGNLAKDQPTNDPLRRLSGNAPILEPLYEHAVSDPVKPRSAENVIPWWDLATRKYRHRSCPSLQVTRTERFLSKSKLIQNLGFDWFLNFSILRNSNLANFVGSRNSQNSLFYISREEFQLF